MVYYWWGARHTQIWFYFNHISGEKLLENTQHSPAGLKHNRCITLCKNGTIGNLNGKKNIETCHSVITQGLKVYETLTSIVLELTLILSIITADKLSLLAFATKSLMNNWKWFVTLKEMWQSGNGFKYVNGSNF